MPPSWTLWSWMHGHRRQSWTQLTGASRTRTWIESKCSCCCMGLHPCYTFCTTTNAHGHVHACAYARAHTHTLGSWIYRRFFLGNWNQAGFLAEGRPTRTLREILTRLRETYCSTTGYEVGVTARSLQKLLHFFFSEAACLLFYSATMLLLCAAVHAHP